MNDTGSIHGSDWREALEREMRRLGASSDDPLIYLEDREDLRIEFRSGTEPRKIHTGHRGVSLEAGSGPVRFVHRSSPHPGDLPGLTDILLGSRTVPGSSGSTAPMPEAPVLDAAEACWLASELAGGQGDTVDGVCRLVRGTYVAFRQRISVISGRGTVREEERGGSRILVEVRARRNGSDGTAISEWVYRPGRPPQPETLLRAAVQRAVARMEARPFPGAELPVVFAAGTGGILLHELIGHSLEGDTSGRGGSALARERPAFRTEDVNVIDDPRRCRVPWRIDDEGEDSRAVALIRSGRVAGKLHDRRSARAWSEKTTGHGRRASYLEPVRPRMGATFLGAGRLDPREVIENTRNGIYVRRMESASVDPASGVAIFRVTDADRIRNGKIDHPVRAFLIRSDLPGTLANLDLVASDLAFDTCVGSCVKDGQPLAASVGAPTFRVGIVRVLKEKNSFP